MTIKVLGSGCPKCKKLEALVRECVTDLGLDADIEKVTDMKDILSYGVMSTPALVVEGKVVLKGTVPPKSKIIELLGSSTD